MRNGAMNCIKILNEPLMVASNQCGGAGMYLKKALISPVIFEIRLYIKYEYIYIHKRRYVPIKIVGQSAHLTDILCKPTKSLVLILLTFTNLCATILAAKTQAYLISGGQNHDGAVSKGEYLYRLRLCFCL